MMNCRLLALSETRSALPPPSPFSLSLSSFLLHCPPRPSLYPSLPLCFFFFTFFSSLPFLWVFKHLPCRLLFFSVPPTFLLLHSLPVPLLPPWFPLLSSLFYSGLFNSLLLCHSSVCMILSLSFTLLRSSTFPALYVSVCSVETQGSRQKQPVFGSVWSILSLILLRSYEMSKFIRTLEGDIFSPCLLHTSTATMTVTY